MQKIRNFHAGGICKGIRLTPGPIRSRVTVARQYTARPGSARLYAEAPPHRTSDSGYSACSHPPLRHAGIEPSEQGPPLAHVSFLRTENRRDTIPFSRDRAPLPPPPHSKSGLLSCLRAVFVASMSHSRGITMRQQDAQKRRAVRTAHNNVEVRGQRAECRIGYRTYSAASLR